MAVKFVRSNPTIPKIISLNIIIFQSLPLWFQPIIILISIVA